MRWRSWLTGLADVNSLLLGRWFSHGWDFYDGVSSRRSQNDKETHELCTLTAVMESTWRTKIWLLSDSHIRRSSSLPFLPVSNLSGVKYNVLDMNTVSCSLRRVYVINKELCVKTVCLQEELLKGETTNNCLIIMDTSANFKYLYSHVSKKCIS